MLDSYAVLAFLFQEKGHEKILSLFEKATEALLIARADAAAEEHARGVNLTKSHYGQISAEYHLTTAAFWLHSLFVAG